MAAGRPVRKEAAAAVPEARDAGNWEWADFPNLVKGWVHAGEGKGVIPTMVAKFLAGAPSGWEGDS